MALMGKPDETTGLIPKAPLDIPAMTPAQPTANFDDLAAFIAAQQAEQRRRQAAKMKVPPFGQPPAVAAAAPTGYSEVLKRYGG